MKSNIKLFIFMLFFLFSSSLRSQNTYTPPRLITEIFSNIEVGVKREGYTKTFFNYQIEKQISFNNTNSSSLSQSIIQNNTHIKKRETNKDYYNSRPKASSLLGGIARAYAGDYSGLLDFGGKTLDHMMTPRFLTHETSTYSTTKNYTQSSNNSLNNVNEIKNIFKNEIEQEIKVGANSGFIKFSLRVYNASHVGVKINRPKFAMYFVMPNGTRDLISIDKSNIVANESTYYIEGNGSIDFEINIQNQDVQSLFSKYLESKELEIDINQLEVYVEDEAIFSGEIVQQFEESSVRVKYYNGNSLKDFYAIINETRPTFKDLLKNYIGVSSYSFYDVPEDSLLDGYVKKIAVFENKYSDKKIDRINGQELIDWRKWIVTVYDRDNNIIPFQINDVFEPGYKLALSYFSASDLMGVNYNPIVYQKNDIHFSANGTLEIPFDLKIGDKLILENIKFEKLYTDEIKYKVSKVSKNKLYAGRGIFSQAQTFLNEQRIMENGINRMTIYPNFVGSSNYQYWFIPEEIYQKEKFFPKDFVLIDWKKNNIQLEKELEPFVEEINKNANGLARKLLSLTFNVLNPELTFENVQGLYNEGITNEAFSINAYIDQFSNNNNWVKLLKTEIGREKLNDSIRKSNIIEVVILNDILEDNNKWVSPIRPNLYYSFLLNSNKLIEAEELKLNALTIGNRLIKSYIKINTGSRPNYSYTFNYSSNNNFKFQLDENLINKFFSLNTLIGLPAGSTINSSYNIESQGQNSVLTGNRKLFDISFDLKIIRAGLSNLNQK